MMRALRRAALAILLLALSTLPASAGQSPAQKYDWSGWWFLYHRDESDNLVLDKFRLAMVVEDTINGHDGLVSGAWSGCIWNPATRLQFGKDRVRLRFQDKRFTMTRTGSDEAEGSFSDNSKRVYTARRLRSHGDCAGYGGDPEPK